MAKILDSERVLLSISVKNSLAVSLAGMEQLLWHLGVKYPPHIYQTPLSDKFLDYGGENTYDGSLASLTQQFRAKNADRHRRVWV
jgi:hypothetical protein